MERLPYGISRLGWLDGFISIEFSPDGRHLACCIDGNVRVWDVGNKTISIERSLEHISHASYLEFLLHVRYFAAAFGWGFVGTLDLSIGTHQTVLTGHESSAGWVAFSPNGSQLVSVSYDSVYVWNTENWTRDKVYGLDSSSSQMMATLYRSMTSVGGTLHRCFHAQQSTTQVMVMVLADITTFPAPRFPVFLSDDRCSLCLKKGDQTIHFCWFPDSFVASLQVAWYNDMMCLGGSSGEVLWIDLAGFEVPDI